MVNCGGVKAAMARARAPIVLLVLALGGGLLLRNDFTAAKQPTKGREASLNASSAEAAFGRLPLAFEPNQGQTDARVKFLAHGAGYGIFLTASEAVLSLPGATGQSVLEMQLVGSQIGSQNAARVEGLAQLPGRSNYFIGNDRSRWRTNIPQFSHVLYSGVYPGIDLDFYGKQGRLEYDLDVSPGADFRPIELDFNGAEDVRLARDGSLVVRLNGREVRFDSPKIYQQSISGDQHVGGGFVLRNDHRVAFEVGEYDRSRTLIIDPVLTFSTFLGGTGDESCAKITGAAQFVAHCPSVAVDAAQRVYMAGVTSDSSSFPVSAGGASDIPSPLLADPNVFVTRINSSGTAVDFTTFIGGSGSEYPVGVAIDSGFNVYVAGTTNSADFPTTAAAFQPSATGTHVFFSKLGQDGSANEYSTYLAGSGTDIAASLAVDGQGLAYLFGTTSLATTNPHFPTTPTAIQETALAANQFFFSKLNTSANVSGPNTLAYSTFIGGSTPTTGTVTGGAIAVDSANPANVYIAGGTTFTDMPLLNASQPTFPSKTTGTNSVWLARLNAPANNTQQYTPSFETYFGGSGDDIAYGVATDGTNTLLTGSTTSPNITIPSGVAPFQACLDQSSPNQTPCPSNVSASDAFIAKFGLPPVTGTTQGMVPLSYFTYLGGTGTDVGLAIVSDAGVSTGNVRVTGLTGDSSSWSAPVQNKLGPGGATDAFLARILTTTTTTTTTTTANTSTVTFLGGSNTDIGTSLAEDVDLNAYIVGETFSGNFPTAAQPGSVPLQSAIGGTNDAFVSKLGPNVNGLLSFVCNSSAPVSGPGCPSPKPSNPTVNPTPVGIGNPIKFVYSIYNQGDPVTGVVFTDTVQGTNSTIASASVGGGSGTGGTSSGTCTVGSGGTTAVCNLGTVNTSNTTTTTSGSTTTATTGVAAQVTVTVNATVPAATGVIPPKPPDVGNIGQLSVPAINFSSLPASGSAQVNDFGIEPAPGSPTSQTVTAGDTATYSLQLVPTGPIPEAVTLSATGEPTQSGPSFSPQSIPNLNNGPQSVTLKISTTVRVTTPASLFRHGGWSYAIWLPISGLALLGGSLSRRRRVLLAMSFAALLIVLALQPACGYGSKNTSSTTGTPAGTYNITVNAVSGGTRSTVVQLVVK